MSGALIAMGLILAWISTCLVDTPLSVIALVGGTGVALMVGGVHSAKAKGERIEVHCKGCGKKPSELEEYISAAQDNNMTPDDYVVQEEGTYNHNTGEFWCTSCYVKAGCPLGKA